MARKDAQVRARMEADLKERAESIMRELGVTPSAAVNMLYRQVALRGKLPFEVSLPRPNAETIEAMRAADERVGITDADTADELFRRLEDE